MAKRVIDGPAMWRSTKIYSLPAWARPEFSWCLALSDANGSFEINARNIWGDAYTNRDAWTPERVTELFSLFERHGLLFVWECGGKTFGHWANIEMHGLPRPSRRSSKYEKMFAPSIPQKAYKRYLALTFPTDNCRIIDAEPSAL
jgi:hypothetical protein